MSSATKALTLLSYFSATRPEIGLSQMCRIAGRDKATTYRHLQALETAGFVEQIPATKQYRLGPALLQLAQVREATVPRKDGAKAALAALANATGETAHATLLSGNVLYGLCDCESPHHSTRAVIDMNVFPLHATASGLCTLAFGPEDLLRTAVANLEAFTENTATTETELEALIENVRLTGFGRGDKSFATETQGLAAPVFDHTGHLAGAVAVASVASRFTAELECSIKSELIIAAREITRNWGGTIPDAIEALWTTSLNNPTEMEPTS
ncbi:helix-turn-helix domain-containing protein [Tropicibacter sp. R15_0]|uniref:IclR family transcriptional regulator n=1 Tax=Tropicibacter sp. R15_0 TaxID=2821101 RepID=UPI001ADD4D32|nr:IclR family transcriptional regulator C-terminal domain-containing protein [Tropicibacter sp. R15_0]MBO9468219.1 helix-turn-helix domain-containing protein [Tropicibacter sp. R15_0]